MFEAHLDELCTHVPPRRTRVPADGTGVPLGDAVDDLGAEAGSWLSAATVRASSYVVPPIMNTITSCGLRCNRHEARMEPTCVLSPTAAATNSGRHPAVPPQTGSLCPRVDPTAGAPASATGAAHAECTRFPRPTAPHQLVGGSVRHGETHLAPFEGVASLGEQCFVGE